MILAKQVVQQAGVPNRNGNVYPKEVLEKAIEDFKKKPAKTVIGQFGPLDNPFVSLSLATHIVEDMRLEDDKLVADIKILDTPHGKLIKSLLNDGVKISFEMQGTGTVKVENGIQVIQDDYHFISVGIKEPN